MFCLILPWRSRVCWPFYLEAVSHYWCMHHGWRICLLIAIACSLGSRYTHDVEIDWFPKETRLMLSHWFCVWECTHKLLASLHDPLFNVVRIFCLILIKFDARTEIFVIKYSKNFCSNCSLARRNGPLRGSQRGLGQQVNSSLDTRQGT